MLDSNPVSLRYAQAPLTYTADTYAPVIPEWFSVYELDHFHERRPPPAW